MHLIYLVPSLKSQNKTEGRWLDPLTTPMSGPRRRQADRQPTYVRVGKGHIIPQIQSLRETPCTSERSEHLYLPVGNPSSFSLFTPNPRWEVYFAKTKVAKSISISFLDNKNRSDWYTIYLFYLLYKHTFDRYVLIIQVEVAGFQIFTRTCSEAGWL